MAAASSRPVQHFTDMESALALLRQGGGRLSSSRRVILEVLLRAEGPRSTEQIADAASPPLDLASTYRNLEHLGKLGLVRHVHLGHRAASYELATEGEHEYAFCERCGASQSFDPTRLDEARREIKRSIGYSPSFEHFPLVGLCLECMADEQRDNSKE